MDLSNTKLVACTLGLLILPVVQALPQSGGEVRIESISMQPTVLRVSGAEKCVWATVRIEVTKGAARADPTLEYGLVKSSSDPSTIEMDIKPSAIRATLSGNASIHHKVCWAGGSNQGKFVLTAGILGVGPSGYRFDREHMPLAEFSVVP